MRKTILFIFCYCFYFCSYSQDNILLKIKGQEIEWGQCRNNDYDEKYNKDAGCSPSYNKFSSSNSNKEDCKKDPAGCAAIAIGQIMAMWQYPNKSKFRTYNWNNIKPVLRDGDPDDCPQLIKDIADLCNMHYHTSGSWAAPHNLVDALNEFGYYADLEDYDYWGRYKSTNEWYDLIRSEIDCGRPVIMYGENKNVFNAHYFVLDGYDKDNPYLFHINKGWCGYNYFYDIRDWQYPDDRKIICGIYPKRSGMPKITYERMANFILPNCNYNIGGTYKVENADSWMCKVFDRKNKIVWMTGGLIKNGLAKVWDGSSSFTIGEDDYWYEITFKNSNGAREVVYDHVHYMPNAEYSVKNFNYSLSNDNIAPYCNEGYDYIEFESNTALLYTAEISDSYDNVIWKGNGTFEDGIAKVWNGEGAIGNGYYKIDIEFEGGCKKISKEKASYQVYYDGNDCFLTSIDTIKSDFNYEIKLDKASNILNINCKEKINTILIYDVSMRCILKDVMEDYNKSVYLDKLKRGVYFIIIKTENSIYSEKILL